MVSTKLEDSLTLGTPCSRTPEQSQPWAHCRGTGREDSATLTVDLIFVTA